MYQELAINGNFTTEEALKHKVKLHEMAAISESIKLDLRNVEMADIVGVNVLVTTHKILKDRGKVLVINVSQNSELMTLLQLTKFTEILHIK